MKSYCVTLNREKILPHMEEILAEKCYCEFVHKKRYPCEDGFIEVMLFEKLHLRTTSYSGLTVVLVSRKEVCYADVFAFAGGDGILNIDWGAGNSLAKEFVTVLEEFV